MQPHDLGRRHDSSDRGPAAAPPPGAIRRHILSGAVITALGGLLFGYDTGVMDRVGRRPLLFGAPRGWRQT